MKLSGKSVVYVGGFGGIGLASCVAMLKKGVKCLTILDLKEDTNKLQQLRALNSAAKVHFLSLNLLDGREKIQSTLQEVISNWGEFNILVNGSGIINDRNPKLTIDINLLGLIDTTLAAIQLMGKQECGNGGLIVNLASVLGLTPGPFLAVYTASKHGIVGFTRSLADPHYYNVTGIEFMTFCPGATVTNILETFVGVDTFDFIKELSEKYIQAKNQPAEICGEHMAEAIEATDNGDVWISDLGKLRKVDIPTLWNYTFE